VRTLDRVQPLGLLVLRLVLGIILIAHGKGKILGGIARHMATVANLGFPAWVGYLSAGTEFFGGILLILGLLTRWVSVAVAIEMLVIVFKVDWKEGLLGGFEFPLALSAMAFSLIWFGGGPISLDWLFSGKKGERL
jgi:putative oxidoreductase